MAYVQVSSIPRRFGVTKRRDAWWATPLLVFTGLSAFVVYSTWGNPSWAAQEEAFQPLSLK